MKTVNPIISVLITIHDNSIIPLLEQSVKGFKLKEKYGIATGYLIQSDFDNLKKDTRITLEISQEKHIKQ